MDCRKSVGVSVGVSPDETTAVAEIATPLGS